MHRLLWMLWILTADSTAPAEQKFDLGPIAVRVDCARPTIPLSDAARVSITLTAPAHVEVAWPATPESNDSFRVIDTATEGPDRAGRFHSRRWHVRFEPLRLGKVPLGSVRLRYRDGTDEWQDAAIGLPTLEVVAGPTSSSDPATLRPIVPLPATSGRANMARVLRWLAVGIVILALAGWGWRACRPPPTPRANAIGSLAALRTEPHDPDEARRLAGQACTIIREYLEARYGIAALRRTSPELLADLARVPDFAPERLELLKRLLEVSAPPRFAADPRPADVRTLLDYCHRFLDLEPVP